MERDFWKCQSLSERFNMKIKQSISAPGSFGKFEFCDEVPTPVSSKSIYILDDEREEMRAAMQESGLSEYCVGDYSVFYIK